MTSPLQPTGIREHQRIVRSAIQFDAENRTHMRQRISHCAVYLRHAAQTVRILHARIFFRRAMRLAYLTSAIEFGDVARGNRLPRVLPHRRDARIERGWAAAQCVE